MKIEDFLVRLDGRLDKFDERQGRMEQTQARHDQILKDHIRRTELAEARLERLEANEPKTVTWPGVLKILTGVTALLGIFKAFLLIRGH